MNEELREAARLMRERAEAATAGPWRQEPDTMAGRVWVRLAHDGDLQPMTEPDELTRGRRLFSVRSMRDLYWPKTQEDVFRQRGADAAHIASWHPAVALAVADWLDAAAANSEAIGYDGPGQPGSPHAKALAVARAYLR